MPKPILIITVPTNYPTLDVLNATKSIQVDYHVLVVLSVKTDDVSYEVVYPTARPGTK